MSEFCPVCKVTISETTKVCPECGFADLHREFINKEDAQLWFNSIVIPYRNKWIEKEESKKLITYNKDEFQIENGVLIKYIGNKDAVIIPNGVKVIDKCAFYCCESLTNITIPSSVTEVGEYPFYGCINLISIKVDIANPKYCSLNGILFDKKLQTIIRYPISKKDKVYTIPDNVENIESGAFSWCKNLTNVIIPGSVTSIGINAFRECEKLSSIIVDKANYKYCTVDGILFNKEMTSIICFPPAKEDETYIIPNSVKSIENCAFCLCKNLTNITIPGCVTNIRSEAFSECINLRNLTILDGVTNIENEAFSWCENLTSITIPNTVIHIGNEAFAWCKSLTNAILPNSLTTINKVFVYSENLMSVTIPITVTTIVSGAFCGCEKLIINCYDNSYAHKYALENNIRYELI